MKALGFYIRLYFIIMSQYIKARMQFRADFIIGTVGVIFENITGIFTLWILFRTIPNLEGWSYNELIFIYAYSQLALICGHLFFVNIWSLGNHLREGSFIKYYFKPLNMMFYYMSEDFDIKGLSQLVFSIVALVYSSMKLGLVWDPLKLGMLIVTVSSASLIMISLLIIAGSMGFWTTDTFSLLNFTIRFHGFSKYPMTIFNSFFKFMFTYVIPVGFVAFYPSQLFLRPGDNSALVMFSPLVGVMLFVIAYAIWTKGVKSYSGTGS